MIRFPNPGTNVDAFIDTFKTIYKDLNQYKSFDLDMMSKSLAESNRAASEGNIGIKALKLSTRDDRSRDPIYNNSKMYAELYRTLGWISSTGEKTLIYRFTYLGDHVGNSQVDPKLLFEECLIGINYPNQILSIKSDAKSRTMALILKYASRLDGYITRDEMIMGPMNLDESIHDSFETNIKFIRNCRRNNTTQEEVASLAKRLKIQLNTLRNYTRFPISVLTSFGYFSKESSKSRHLNNGEKVILVLTKKGRDKVAWLESCFDVRLDSIKKLSKLDQNDLIKIGFYELLGRSNFDLSSVPDVYMGISTELKDVIAGRDVLFSPYQTLKVDRVDSALGIDQDVGKEERPVVDLKQELKTVSEQPKIKVNKGKSRAQNSSISKYIDDCISKGYSDEKIISSLFKKLADDTKDLFYNYIADLFCIIGYNCRASRSGINYERWDAIIEDSQFSIPIEIKSPREEKCVGTKAVRQALENKIVLLSRKSYVTDNDSISLAVGYYPPNERAEVSGLIDDIYNTYKIRIGELDTLTLIELAVKARRGVGVVDKDQFRLLRGILSVGDL